MNPFEALPDPARTAPADSWGALPPRFSPGSAKGFRFVTERPGSALGKDRD
jgi:hypothetical protein